MRFSSVAVFLIASGGLACARSSERPPDSAAARDVPGAAGSQLVVTPTAFGPVRFGQPLLQVARVLGEKLHAAYDYNETCDYVRPTKLPAGVSLMVVYDTVMRVDVDTAGVRTAEGASVGDPESRILELYKGRVRVEPHHYTGPEGHYLVVMPPADTLHRIIFETDGKRVINYRAGRRPAVEYVEGCS